MSLPGGFPIKKGAPRVALPPPPVPMNTSGWTPSLGRGGPAPVPIVQTKPRNPRYFYNILDMFDDGRVYKAG